LALNRIVRYWEHRRKVFGPDKFARPMTLNGAMEGRIDALKQGFLYLLPVLDEAGRAIIYSSYSSQDPHLNMRAEDKIQVWWYLLHVAMEMPGVAEKGFVILSNGENFRLNNFDGKWNVAACCSGDRDFPIRWKMAHICHSNAVFPFLASAVKAVLSPKQRESFILHNGSTATVLGSLSEYSLPKHCVPEDLGGSLHVSIDDFVRERLVIEGGASDLDINNEGNSSISQAGHSILVHEMQKGANGVETGSFIGSRGLHCDIPGDNQSDGTRSELTPMEAEPTNANPIINPKTMGKMPFAPPVLENGRNTSFAPEVPAQEEPKKGRSNLGNIRQTSQAGTSKSHPGRTGDPRMNGAVQAKLDNPNLPLVAALFAGGFVFPDIDTPGVKLKDVKDTDNVTVNQRKNQLLRRLRDLYAESSSGRCFLLHIVP
ncbi:hypothetical protein ACHAXR_007472, partial [Thalassiosira sp. AJA248-18]